MTYSSNYFECDIEALRNFICLIMYCLKQDYKADIWIKKR